MGGNTGCARVRTGRPLTPFGRRHARELHRARKQAFAEGRTSAQRDSKIVYAQGVKDAADSLLNHKFKTKANQSDPYVPMHEVAEWALEMMRRAHQAQEDRRCEIGATDAGSPATDSLLMRSAP